MNTDDILTAINKKLPPHHDRLDHAGLRRYQASQLANAHHAGYRHAGNKRDIRTAMPSTPPDSLAKRNLDSILPSPGGKDQIKWPALSPPRTTRLPAFRIFGMFTKCATVLRALLFDTRPSVDDDELPTGSANPIKTTATVTSFRSTGNSPSPFSILSAVSTPFAPI